MPECKRARAVKDFAPFFAGVLGTAAIFMDFVMSLPQEKHTLNCSLVSNEKRKRGTRGKREAVLVSTVNALLRV